MRDASFVIHCFGLQGARGFGAIVRVADDPLGARWRTQARYRSLIRFRAVQEGERALSGNPIAFEVDMRKAGGYSIAMCATAASEPLEHGSNREQSKWITIRARHR
jgi:hypothetical protein